MPIMKTSQTLAICVALWISTTFASANLITNGNFDTADFTGWTVTHAPVGSNIDVGANVEFHGFNFGATFGADITFDSISQTFSTTPGTVYLVSFYYQVGFVSDPSLLDNEFQALFNSAVIFHDLNRVGTGQGQVLQFQLVATGATSTLEFQGRNTPYLDFLDDVSVTPLPDTGSSALLLSLGLVALFAVQRGLLLRHS